MASIGIHFQSATSSGLKFGEWWNQSTHGPIRARLTRYQKALIDKMKNFFNGTDNPISSLKRRVAAAMLVSPSRWWLQQVLVHNLGMVFV